MQGSLGFAPRRTWIAIPALLLALGCSGAEGEDKDPAAPCPAGQAPCGAACVELERDPSHCGACGVACGPEARCEAGACVPRCEAPLALCEGACVDFRDDAAHCGGCGQGCEAGAICEEGACQRCGEGLIRCAEACVDPLVDERNCGACGVSCGAREICFDGACAPICSGEESFCEGACVRLESDAAHCGACGFDCAALPNVRQAPACEASACVFECAEGFAACGADWTSGCETELAVSVAHCGRCGNDCAGKAMVEAASCSESLCKVERCLPGWGDCDGDGENGCETETASDAQNCGACGQVCEESAPNASGVQCLEGSCAPICESGFGDCDGDVANGCEQPLDSDPANCGACDTQCHACKAGVCERIVSSAAGIGFNCVAIAAGPVYCWGSNAFGLLGAENGGDATRPTALEGLRDVRQLAAGPTHLCALTNGGEVWCVGQNNNGQLGNGDTEHQRVPVRVQGLQGITQIAAGVYHTCAVDEVGGVHCWGYNAFGQIGDGSTDTRLTPYRLPELEEVAYVGTGIYHTCAILRSGTMFCWGDNRTGTFGDGTQESSLTPKQNHHHFDYAKMAGGWFHSCFLMKNGVVACSGFAGALGTGDDEDSTVPRFIEGLEEVVDIAANRNASCAHTESGQLYCWGSNEEQELGMDVEHLPTPALVPGLEGVESVHFGWRELTCALTREEGLYCWGLNGDARLGAQVGAEGSIEPLRIPF